MLKTSFEKIRKKMNHNKFKTGECVEMKSVIKRLKKAHRKVQKNTEKLENEVFKYLKKNRQLDENHK